MCFSLTAVMNLLYLIMTCIFMPLECVVWKLLIYEGQQIRQKVVKVIKTYIVDPTSSVIITALISQSSWSIHHRHYCPLYRTAKQNYGFCKLWQWKILAEILVHRTASLHLSLNYTRTRITAFQCDMNLYLMRRPFTLEIKFLCLQNSLQLEKISITHKMYKVQ